MVIGPTSGIQKITAIDWDNADVKDITTYCSVNGSINKEFTPEALKSGSWAGELEIVSPGQTSEVLRTGRGLVAKCCHGTWWSITVRGKRRATAASFGPYVRPTLKRELPTGWRDTYTPDPELPGGCVFTIKQVCDALAEMVFPRDQCIGLVIISGATGAAKSQIARGLVYAYMEKCADRTATRNRADARRPHLITAENPIESYRYKHENEPIGPDTIAQKMGIDYTPRDYGEGCDVATLHQALMLDALRQTPTVVYVGEIRKSSELRTVLEFAATGHLIVTTMHAGSLVETMEKAFGALRARTPAERGQTASRIRALVHLKNLDSDNDDVALVPAVWVGEPAGIAGIVSDGLSSLIPHRFTLHKPESPLDRRDLKPTMGRTHMLECILSGNTSGNEKLIRNAIESDLQGV